METLVGVVHGFALSRSLVVVIPSLVQKRLNISEGATFSVKLDDQNRIIYEGVGRP